MSENALAPLEMEKGTYKVTSIEGAYRLAQYAVKSGLVPQTYNTPEKVLVAWEFGGELGLSRMQSLVCLSVVRNIPAIGGKHVHAIVLGKGILEEFKEWTEGVQFQDDFTAICKVRRKGLPGETVKRYSVADAKRAQLWGKQGPWSSDPALMLCYRARSRAFNALFADVLCGLPITEEVLDYTHLEKPSLIPVEGSVQPAPQKDALMEQLLGAAPIVEGSADPVPQGSLQSEANVGRAGAILDDAGQRAPRTPPQESAELFAPPEEPGAVDPEAEAALAEPRSITGNVKSLATVGNRYKITLESGFIYWTEDKNVMLFAKRAGKGGRVTIRYEEGELGNTILEIQ